MFMFSIFAIAIALDVPYDAEKDGISLTSSGVEHHSSSNENTTSNITLHAVDDGDDDLREEEEPIAPAQVNPRKTTVTSADLTEAQQVHGEKAAQLKFKIA